MSSLMFGYYTDITYAYGALTWDEIYHNAERIANNLRSMGWTDNAIAGILSNIEHEGIYNPGQCEGSGGRVPYSDYEPMFPYGLGLCQWTSTPNLLMDYARNNGTVWYNGDIQCKLMNTGVNYFINTIHPDYNFPYSFEEFKRWEGSPFDSACGWLYNYERPASIDDNGEQARRTRELRGRDGLVWYEWLTNTPYTPVVDSNLIVTLIAKRKKDKGGRIVIR